MTQEDWTKMNKESHYNSLIKQDSANRKLIKKLQLERDKLKEQLRTGGESQQREQLSRCEHKTKKWIAQIAETYCPMCREIL